MLNNLLIAAAVILLTSGCMTPAEKAAEENAKKQQMQIQLSPLQKKIMNADSLVKQNKFQEAYIIYCEAQNETTDEKLYKNLQVKIAAVLYEMQNYHAALAALAPMPELPGTLNDCQKMAIAAKILKKMNGKPEHIEALLEVALDNSIDEPGAIEFKAAAYAELGKVYVENRKTYRAVKSFEYAATLFDMINETEQAKICRNIIEYLK